MKHIVTFGEILGRISPPGHLRFPQAMPGTVSFTFAGAEANVAASVAYLGGSARFVTALPENDISRACLASLRKLGVDVSPILFTDEGRLGIYYTETGANQRPGRVIYDREHSAISLTPAARYDWASVFKDAGWLHVTGITPALGKTAAETTIRATEEAKKHGLTVSCDLNFRAKLWKWDPDLKPAESAGKTMRAILPQVDILVANEEDAASVLGIEPDDNDVEGGKLNIQGYESVAIRIAKQFPGLKAIATTFRESISASHNNWGAMLFDCSEQRAYYAPQRDGRYAPYPITHIVDRVGGGDSFAAGLIFALNTPDLNSPQDAVSFATAASCLAHSISGDFNFTTRSEVESLMKGSSSGRVVR